MRKGYTFLLLWCLFMSFCWAQEKNIPLHRIIFSDEAGENGQAQHPSADHAYFSFLHPETFLEAYNPDPEDSLSYHCPDPIVIPLGDAAVLVYINTDWWLSESSSPTAEGMGCNCLTQRDVVNRLRDIVYENRNKMMLVALKHPVYNVGREAGFFTWKDHFFPLTAVDPKLYVPLPIVGSLAPLYHSVFMSRQEMRHPLYKIMMNSITDVFSGHPNLLFISSSGGGLKVMQAGNPPYLQIISGQKVAKRQAVKDEGVLFEELDGGHVVADFKDRSTIRWLFYGRSSTSQEPTFVYDWKAKAVPNDVVAESALTEDSISIQAHTAYDRGGLYTFFLGKNYRKEWSMSVKLPVLRISELHGGLRPVRLGGGLQSTSLRLVGNDGKQYALRSVEKKPDLIVPHPFEGTIVRDVLDDVISSQHPYSALAVPPIAKAVGVPHTEPIIGVVAPDTGLHMYNSLFQNRVALLEEREPLGKSDNYIKAFKALQRDHDNSFNAPNFLKARMVDLMVGDWDRHADQWRFFDEHEKRKDAHKYYTVVPRDRDMVFYVTEGLFPVLIKRLFVFPRIRGFDAHVEKGVLHNLYKSSFLNAHPANQFDHAAYMNLVKEVQEDLTDTVLEASVKKLPQENYALRGKELLGILKSRRDGLQVAMDRYYRFSNKIVDIHLSDKNEAVLIQDLADTDALRITVYKLHKKEMAQDTLMDKVYPKTNTKEIRIYLGEGDDHVRIKNETSSVKLRVIGGKGKKDYVVESSKRKIDVYDRKEAHYIDDRKQLRKHIDKKKDNTAFEAVNLYNTTIPQASLAYNPDDGFYLGLGFVHTQQQGFRKNPYASRHSVMVSHAFATNAFNVHYRGEWLHVLGKADIVLSTTIKAPDNTQNFFGRGNISVFDRSRSQNYYRSRFDLFEMNGGLRWRHDQQSHVSVNLSYQYYHLDEQGNVGRFILQEMNAIGGYDSATVMKDKMHYGITLAYQRDKRDNAILPNWGSFFNVQIQGFAGLNRYSRSYMQVLPQFAVYKSFGSGQRFVLGNRLGGGVTLGHTTFYQSLFLGSEGNLLGYRRYRFAGQHSVYNNLELRWAKRDFGNYLLNGQLGLFFFYDIGRVWEEEERSRKWHQGFGPGLYVAPASLAVFRFSYGYTTEGWYPNFSMGWRF